MKENRIGTFILEPDETPYEVRRWLNLTLSLDSSMLVGNPSEEYIRFLLLSYNSDVARFLISEKKGGVENNIKYEELSLNKSYMLQGTSFVVRCRPNQFPGSRNIRISFSAPRNVDIVRDKVF